MISNHGPKKNKPVAKPAIPAHEQEHPITPAENPAPAEPNVEAGLGLRRETDNGART
jgi:hypothetical protein